MDKYEYIVNLAEKTAKRVSQNRESWMKFLTSAARIYKYPFKEQLLISCGYIRGQTSLRPGKKILNRQTGKNSVPGLLPEIMMQLLSGIANLKKYRFPTSDRKIQLYNRLMRSKKDSRK